MSYEIKITGDSPVIMHCGQAGLDTRSPVSLEIAEIAKKKGTNRTETDDARLAELECQRSLWLDSKGKVTVPERVMRGNIETAARKLKQGPLVREGLIVTGSSFGYDKQRYGSTLDELGKNAQFQATVVVQRNRIVRTRAMFEDWSCVFQVETDPEIVDRSQIAAWLEIGGRRVGIGDWRPAKSGHYGRFTVESIVEI